MSGSLLAAVPSALTGAALVAGVIALMATRRPAVALAVFLDLLLAAGLLRLTGEPDWRAIAGAAALVALRRLLSWGLREGWSNGVSAAPTERQTDDAAARGRRLLSRLVRPAWRS